MKVVRLDGEIDLAACRSLDDRLRFSGSSNLVVDLTQVTLLSGVAIGVSTHHTRPGRVPSAGEQRLLDTVSREAGAWLDWHRRTVVLDVLEDVHRSARSRRSGV